MSKHFKTYETTFQTPDVVDSIDDANEVYGDWPQIDTPCEDSPVGQCEYSAREPETCIHCGRKS